MKVAELVRVIENSNLDRPDIDNLKSSLEKFENASISLLADKLAKMKLPKVDPEQAASELKTAFQDSIKFESKLEAMRSNRDYTKNVFFHIFKSLFRDIKPPASSTKRDDLVERIGRERRRHENLATA